MIICSEIKIHQSVGKNLLAFQVIIIDFYSFEILTNLIYGFQMQSFYCQLPHDKLLNIFCRHALPKELQKLFYSNL